MDIYQTLISVLTTVMRGKNIGSVSEAQETYYTIQAHLSSCYPDLHRILSNDDPITEKQRAQMAYNLRLNKAEEDIVLLQLLLQFSQILTRQSAEVAQAVGVNLQNVQADQVTISDVYNTYLQGKQPPEEGRAPFKGLEYFDVGDADLYFGREKLTAELVEYLHDHRFMAVIGASGSGKSSLVRAGLIPTLKGDKDLEGDAGLPLGSQSWLYIVFTPTHRPLHALVNSLVNDIGLQGDPAVLVRELLGDPRSLQRYAGDLAGSSGIPGQKIVLVIDQFEELFTQPRTEDLDAARENQRHRKAFVDNLLYAVQEPNGALVAVITMRADFYGYCAQFDNLRSYLGSLGESRQKYIGGMGIDELRRAIIKPLSVGNWTYEPELIDQLLDDIGAGEGRMPEPGALPLLSHALLETFNRRSGRQLTLVGYVATGRVQGAIARTAERVYSEKLDDEQRVVARNLFMRLTEPGEGSEDTRRRMDLSELVSKPEDKDKIIAVLTLLAAPEYRLVVLNDGQVEVAHEALIRQWPRMREWMDSYRVAYQQVREISRAAKNWVQHDQAEDWLAHHGTNLTMAVELINSSPLALSQEEQRYLAECTIRQKQLDAAQEALQLSDLSKMGWGVIFPSGQDVSAVKDALGELLEQRKRQAGDLYREFSGADGYRPGEPARRFLARFGIGTGRVDPSKVPFYLLLVGGPETIPFSFQYQLDVQAAVGRVHFDELEDYAIYARSVVAAEREQIALPRRAVFFGATNPDDRATQVSTSSLVLPLSDLIRSSYKGWDVQTIVREQASKKHLSGLIGGEDAPALLFTVTHGMSFPIGSEWQLPRQGALLCSDWPGPQTWRGEISPDFYFSAEDVSPDARLLGSMFFLWSCYSGGTPRIDNYASQAFRNAQPIAPYPFLSRLPQKLISHPNGGALAVVGRVERAWGYSFQMPGNISDWLAFRGALDELLRERPVGLAIDHFNQRYMELATSLVSELEREWLGEQLNEVELASLKTATADARNYLIIGDPAVRLCVTNFETAVVERPVISTITLRRPTELVPEPATLEQAEGEGASVVSVSTKKKVKKTKQQAKLSEDVERAAKIQTPLVGGEIMHFNGVLGTTGKLILPLISTHEFAQRLQSSPAFDLAKRVKRLEVGRDNAIAESFAVIDGIDPTDLAQAGWGVIFGCHASPEVMKALQPLLEMRRAQAGELYREFWGEAGCQPGESAATFLQRHGAGPGLVNPQRMPYYILIVGSLQDISEEFQQGIDIQYATGRVYFDTPEAYSIYARTVVQAESQPIRQHKALLFAPIHGGDAYTTRLQEQLVQPLVDTLPNYCPDWDIIRVSSTEASKVSLSKILQNANGSVLLTAGHGVLFPEGDPQAKTHNGAIMCADWPGQQDSVQSVPTHYIFTAEDLSPEHDLSGSVVILFGSCSVGTPEKNRLGKIFSDSDLRLPAAGISPLARQLLAQPKGALAVVGFTNLMTSYAFGWEHNDLQTTLFRKVLVQVMEGYQVGLALELVSASYTTLASDLSLELQELAYGKSPDPDRIVGTWTAEYDLRNLAIVGDPAVRVR